MIGIPLTLQLGRMLPTPNETTGNPLESKERQQTHKKQERSGNRNRCAETTAMVTIRNLQWPWKSRQLEHWPEPFISVQQEQAGRNRYSTNLTAFLNMAKNYSLKLSTYVRTCSSRMGGGRLDMKERRHHFFEELKQLQKALFDHTPTNSTRNGNMQPRHQRNAIIVS